MKSALEIKEGGVTEQRIYKDKKVKERRRERIRATGTQAALGKDQPASLLLQ